jgi:hypothetical protein
MGVYVQWLGKVITANGNLMVDSPQEQEGEDAPVDFIYPTYASPSSAPLKKPLRLAVVKVRRNTSGITLSDALLFPSSFPFRSLLRFLLV